MLRRRELMGLDKDPDIKFLRHWWCGEDDAPGGILTDRMGTGFDWKLVGNPAHTNGQWVFDGKNSYGSLFGKNTSDWDLGNHFRVSLDADIAKPISINWNAFLDLGSVHQAKKNIGFAVTDKGMHVNWKLKGNNSNPGLTKSLDKTYPEDMILSAECWNVVAADYWILDRGNGFDKCVVSLNGKTHEFQANVPKVAYANLDNNPSYLSRGVVSNDFSTKMRLRNLKIYVYN